LLIGLVVLIVFAVLSARFFLSEADFSVSNPSWNGVFATAQGMGVQPLYDTSDLSSIDSNSTLLVVSPSKNYSLDESITVASFLNRGGRVVVADDFGQANSLLSAIEAPIKVSRLPLCQYDNYYVNQSFPVITDIAATPFTVNVTRLVLNHPSVLDVSGNATAIANTSSEAWLDTNSDYKLDNGERMGVYPVAAHYTYGSGELIVVSDPDIFINSMLDKGDNPVFMKGLFRGAAWMDVSHGRDVTPLVSVYYLLKSHVLAHAGVIALILAACLAFLKRKDIIAHFSGKNN
jgi:hypothetical protein